MSDINFSSLQNNNAFPFGVGIAKGAFPNLSGIQKFGYNPDIASTEEVIWNPGGSVTYPTTAAVIEIDSTSADDISTGTGARTIELQGLDANYNLQIETVTLDQTDSAGLHGISTNTFIRLFRARVATAGSGGVNAGVITCTIGGNTMAQIPANAGQTLQAIYTVPAGKRAYLLSVHSGTSKEKEITLGLYAKPFGNGFNLKVYETFRSRLDRKYDIVEYFDEKTDIELRAKADATTGISGGFELLLEDK